MHTLLALVSDSLHLHSYTDLLAKVWKGSQPLEHILCGESASEYICGEHRDTRIETELNENKWEERHRKSSVSPEFNGKARSDVVIMDS